jgi:hypothetical protein
MYICEWGIVQTICIVASEMLYNSALWQSSNILDDESVKWGGSMGLQ